MNEIITGIDIGTSKICTIISQMNKNGEVEIRGVGVSPCSGLRKGVVVDIDETVKSIKNSVNQAEHMANVEVKKVFINIAGGHASFVKNKGIIAVTGENKEITKHDIERVIEAAKVIAIPADKEIIDVIPIQYIIDGYDEIRDPIGMIGIRLEVDANIVISSTTSVENLTRCIRKANLEVGGIIVSPLAESEVLLSKDEKELGVCILDVGAGTTDISVFKEGTIVYSKLLPVGGDHITNDIAVGLKVSLTEAERLKRQYGFAMSDMVDEDEEININVIGSQSPVKVKVKEICEIIEARIHEIIMLTNKNLIESGLKSSISTGVVLTGGGLSQIKGSIELSKKILNLPVRIGSPDYIGVSLPTYSVAVGIIKYVERHKRDMLNSVVLETKNRQINSQFNLFEKVKEFFSDFFQ
ncbi:MAG: cell division protein FtsA [Thermoanaerobacteraceae bacterium]|nr:cell division protein FtsA [Thermoanaerobacteraceae bacterium]